MFKNRTLKLYICAALLYVAVISIRWYPILFNLGNSFIGRPGADLFDEMWLDKTAVESAMCGHFAFTDSLAYPSGINLFATNLSWLHVLFIAPFVYLLPWPLSWNCCVIFSLLCGGLAALWAVKSISGSNFLALCAGACFLLMPWSFDESVKGHLNQLWTAPLYITVAWFYATIYKPARRRNIFYLAFWMTVTSLVYWMYGLFAFISAFIMFICSLPFISRKAIIHLCCSAILCAIALMPFAIKVYQAQPLLQSGINNRITSNDRRDLIQRALTYSVSLAPYDSVIADIKVLPLKFGKLIPYVMLSCCILLVLLEWKHKNGSMWLVLALIFYILSMGPYCLWNGFVIGDLKSKPVEMPYLILLDSFKPLYRWSLPARAVPCACFFASLWTAMLVNKLNYYKKISSLSRILINSLAISIMFGSSAIAKVGAKPLDCLTFAYIPSFCQKFALQPQGAAVDIPLGFTNNVFQLQIHHGHPIAAEHKTKVRLVEDNSFMQYLFLWNCAAGARADFSLEPFAGKERKACAVYYGTPQTEKEISTQWAGPENIDYLSVLKLNNDYDSLIRNNFRYLTVHKANCFWIDPEKGALIYEALCSIAKQHFGEPIIAEKDGAVFKMPDRIVFADSFVAEVNGYAELCK